MANIYLAEAYSINQLYDKALLQLDNAYATLEKDQSGGDKFIFAKANVLNSLANVYSDKGEPRNAVKKLRQVIKSYAKLKDPKGIQKFQYLNYSNIASLYVLYDMDSAKYFAEKSMALKPDSNPDDKILMTNSFVMGKVLASEKKYNDALENFHKALHISKKSGSELNLEEVYKSMIEVFEKTGRKDSVILYENKLKHLEIQQLQSKYNSLQQVIDTDKEQTKGEEIRNRFVLVFLTLAFLLILGFIGFQLYRKHKASERNIPLQTPEETYSKLLNLIQNGDPAFMFVFEKSFPDFSEKLLKITPTLQNSEIEFCALLKLKLSTKDIARLTFIEARTVQNKKYRIRKRLNIPPATDIYQWFDQF